MGSLYSPSRSPPPKIKPLAVPRSPPSSPPRKVVSDFASFGVPKNASVFGTAVQSAPFSLAGGRAAFGTMRSGTTRAGFDDEEDEEDTSGGAQRVELKESSISLEQVCIVSLLFSCVRNHMLRSVL